MNNGKICIPVQGRDVSEVIEQLAAAEESADMVEVRLDSLADPNKAAIDEVLDHHGDAPWIVTFRPKEQGGGEISPEQRKEFWRSGPDVEFVDLEEDVAALGEKLAAAKIYSYHDFGGVPHNIDEVFKRLADAGDGIIKIAVKAKDAIDAIAVWKLIEKAREANREVIPIAMGEAGKWTRILGLAHGAFLTYSSLDNGKATAPGQITVSEMRDVYRVKELDEATEVYGIIAGDTTYTISPAMQNAAFQATGENAVFVPFQVGDIEAFMRRMVRPESREVELNLRGFAVTNPHKQAIIKYLDDIDGPAKAIGAVNTIKIEEGKLYGFNTDAIGFIEPLKAAFGDLHDARVGVIGAGGAARAVVFALQKEGAEATVYARNINKADNLANEFGVKARQLTTDNRQLTTDIVVNTTPLGTRGPHENEAILTADRLAGVKLVYDLVYNPAETLLMREAKKAGVKTLCGLEMLVAQGAEQFEVWRGKAPSIAAMREAVNKKL